MPAWLWIALIAVTFMGVALWLAYEILMARVEEADDPFDDTWDDDGYWSTDNPTPPDVPATRPIPNPMADFPVHAIGDRLEGFDPMRQPEKRKSFY